MKPLIGLVPSGAVWSGRVAYVGGVRYRCPAGGPCTSSPIFAAYRPRTDRVHEIDLAGSPGGTFTPLGWTGTEVVGFGTQPTEIVSYDPATGTWRTGASAPCAWNASGFRQTAWLGDPYVIPCGADSLGIYDVAADRWETLDAGPSPLNSRIGSAIAWTGRDLIVWSGAVRRAFTPTPDSGSAITLLH